MNGIHDMGGMDGFGPLRVEQNEPIFHADWEKRVFALTGPALVRAGANADRFRHAIERIAPARHLASSYFERWLQAMETLLVECGVISGDEAASLPQPEFASDALPSARLQPQSHRPRLRAKFQAGDRIRVRNLNPAGHTRCPRYARGKAGIIRRDHGLYNFPDTHAHGAGENRQHVYQVEFSARELWGKAERGRVMLDLWEDYLERAASGPVKHGRKRTP
jgi:nitrile hydratase beta subunit